MKKITLTYNLEVCYVTTDAKPSAEVLTFLHMKNPSSIDFKTSVKKNIPDTT